MPHAPLIPLTIGDRVQHGTNAVRFGHIVELDGKYARVQFEDGDDDWIHVHTLGYAPTAEEIWGRLTREIQAGWNEQGERRHRGLMSGDADAVVIPHAQSVCLMGRERCYELK